VRKCIQIFSLWSLACTFLVGCTAIPDVTTRVYVHQGMNSVQVGNTPEQVQYLLNGPPSYVTVIAQGPDTYEVWEYRIGNFLYSETAMIVFLNTRVIAMPRSGHALMIILRDAGLMQPGQLWDSSKKSWS